jgi:DNA replication protein DnaC
MLSNFKESSSFKTLEDPRLEGMLNGAEDFCQAMNKGSAPYWISYLGGTGIGKTHLSKEIFRYVDNHYSHTELYQRRDGSYSNYRECIFMDCRKLAKMARNGEYDSITNLSNVYFLVLDDLGAAYDRNGYIASVYDELINDRLGKWTVITSNLDAEEISEQLDARIASRLVRNNSVRLDLTAPDYNTR